MNKLVQLNEFQKVLADYHISADSKAILKKTKIVALTAPSSSGRNTIIRELLKTGDYYFIVSDTTRKPRVNDGVLEKNGREYWFRDEKDMLADLKQGKFLEAEIIHNQQVSGISIRELKKASMHGKIAITDMDIGGTHNLVEANPSTVAIMVLPPDFKEWQRRIRTRGKMSRQEHRRRIETAQTIFKVALQQDYFAYVVNQNYQQSAAVIDTLVKTGSENLKNKEDGRKLIKELLHETQNFLES